MRPGQIVELILKNGTRVVGYYQHTEKGNLNLSMDFKGNYSWDIVKKDIKETIEL